MAQPEQVRTVQANQKCARGAARGPAFAEASAWQAGVGGPAFAEASAWQAEVGGPAFAEASAWQAEVGGQKRRNEP